MARWMRHEMLFRWTARILLSVATLLVGYTVSWLVLFWSFGFYGESADPSVVEPFPTPNDWLNIFATVGGVALAAVFWTRSRRLTREEQTPGAHRPLPWSHP